jgi:Holliday junction resolvase RusA-like endonuclease
MISFVIPGVPVPQGRPRVTSAGHAYYDKRTAEYRDKVKECANLTRTAAEKALANFADDSGFRWCGKQQEGE